MIRSCRSAARNVIVLQRPSGTLPIRRLPRGAQPRSGAMLVLVQVSSMKTRRAGSTRSWYLIHCARRRATSGRSRSPATTLFFEAQPLVVDKGPDRAVVNLQTALGEFAHQPEQGEVLLLDPRQQPYAVLARYRAGFVAADLTRRHAAGVPQALHPPDRRADADAKLRRRPMTRKATGLNRCHHPFAKINGIGSTHRMLASNPASILNQKPTDLGIQNRFRIMSCHFSLANADRALLRRGLGGVHRDLLVLI